MPYKDPEKKKAAKKAWKEHNRERIAAINKTYCERNRERIATTSKIYRERNRERIAITEKAWNERNRERRAITNKAWNERNRERRAIINKAWKERNPELVREKVRRRRAKKKNAQVTLTANEKTKLLVLERTRSKLQEETGRVYHLDHILPLAHGGLHHPLNLRILEDAENLSKKDKLLPEAIALAPEHFRLYSERVSPERAWEFVRQLAAGLGINEEELDCLVEGTVPQIQESKPTLEDFIT